jgi:hypothetical protein
LCDALKKIEILELAEVSKITAGKLLSDENFKILISQKRLDVLV